MIKHLDASDQTLQLDNILNSAFNIHKRRSFIIENLQLLHPSAALLFYNYCDNDNAAFKDVMILFTLYFDEKEERIQSSDSVENYLEKMWSRSLAVDKVKPLMSRVANNIVIVRDDSSVTLSDICS
uniref:Torsin-1A-interacting protein 1/2 AAA+ activator domain-containing protein n=1 Tax=Arion vulgaris TaxID=1028688 RepID=A0A0B6ZPX7_9EUPU